MVGIQPVAGRCLRDAAASRYSAGVLSTAKLMTAVVLGALVAATATPAAHAATTRSCGSVHLKNTATDLSGGRVDALRVSCSRARFVVRYALAHQSEFGVGEPPGWECGGTGGAPEFTRVAMTCKRGSARVRLLYR